MNSTGSTVSDNKSNFAVEFPQHNDWMDKYRNSETIQYAVGIAKMKAAMFSPKTLPGTRYWLRTADHGSARMPGNGIFTQAASS